MSEGVNQKTIPTKLEAQSYLKYLSLLDHLDFLSLKLKSQVQLLE